MATITVEDGTGLTNSTSYVSEATFTAYNGERNVTLGGANGTASEVLILAMDYIELQNFKGSKQADAQALVWPRNGVVVNEYYVPETTIPLLLKEAQMEFAIAIDSGNNPLADIDRETKKEKVDVIEVEYMDNALSLIYLNSGESKLRKLLKPSFGSFRV